MAYLVAKGEDDFPVDGPFETAEEAEAVRAALQEEHDWDEQSRIVVTAEDDVVYRVIKVP